MERKNSQPRRPRAEEPAKVASRPERTAEENARPAAARAGSRSRPAAESSSRAGRAALEGAASAIADGREVDWETLLGRTDRLLHPRLHALRALQQLARSSTAPEPELPPCLFTWGPLRVLEKVGAGGFGEVFRAWDPVLEREVALKLGRRGRSRGEHLDEARRLARLRDPNVLAVYGVEEHDGRAGMWTEFVRGETLEERLSRQGVLPWPELVRVARDLCRALAVVHDAGIIHGDIKASNVMIDLDGRTILMDFGAGTTRRGGQVAIAGTPLAMAPELFSGAEPSVATDLYALGVLLYRLASGRYPFEARTRAALARRVQDGARVPLRELRPEMPEALSTAIERALSLQPAGRPRDARQYEAALRLAAPGLSSSEPVEAGGGEAGPRFIGRRREMEALHRLLAEARLVTIAGVGGAGKTRLARQCVLASHRLFPDGVHWVSLAPVVRPDDVLREVAARLGVGESRGAALLDQVMATLAEQDALLVLDNCEHLAAASAELARRLLESCPRLRILATSRVPLRIDGEQTLNLRAMEAPPAPRPGGIDGLEIAGFEAVRLFVDRVALARPGFVLDGATAPAVARICRRLDGIPLALELAAARARAMALEEIAARLDEGFRLLDRVEVGRDDAQRTLEASIDWSWQILQPKEQAALRRLSVFAGRWSLAAAERVLAAEDLAADDVAQVVESLVAQSLVVFEPRPAEDEASPTPPGEGPLAYRLLEPIRGFARRRLKDRNEEESRARAAHFAWFAELARRADPALLASDQKVWAERLAAEHDNCRAALRWAAETPDRAEAGLNLANNLRRFWYVRGHLTEGRDYILGFARQETVPAEIRGRGLSSCATLTWMRGEFAETRRLCEEALQVVGPEGDPAVRAAALAMLAVLCSDTNDLEAARRYGIEALRIREQGGASPGSIASLQCNLGVISARLGDLDQAIAWYEKALAHYRALGDRSFTSTVIGNLSASYMDQGDLARARSLADEGLAMAIASGERRAIAQMLHVQSRIAAREERWEAARDLAVELADYRADDADWRVVIDAIEVLAEAETAWGRFEEAALFTGVALAQRERTGWPRPEPSLGRFRRVEEAFRAGLGPAAADAAMRRGALLSLTEVVARARASRPGAEANGDQTKQPDRPAGAAGGDTP